jgi:hypothetical protein
MQYSRASGPFPESRTLLTCELNIVLLPQTLQACELSTVLLQQTLLACELNIVLLPQTPLACELSTVLLQQTLLACELNTVVLLQHTGMLVENCSAAADCTGLGAEYSWGWYIPV